METKSVGWAESISQANNAAFRLFISPITPAEKAFNETIKTYLTCFSFSMGIGGVATGKASALGIASVVSDADNLTGATDKLVSNKELKNSIKSTEFAVGVASLRNNFNDVLKKPDEIKPVIETFIGTFNTTMDAAEQIKGKDGH